MENISTSDETEVSSELSNSSRNCFGKCLGKCFGCSKESWNLLKSFLHFMFTLSGNVPSNLYTTDFRLLFVLTAIYTSLVTHFRQAGNQETEQDIVSGRLFKVNSIWTNHSVSGGVSDRILWNCRSDSQTVSYYKSLYLGLLIFTCAVIIVYWISSMIINFLIAFAAFKIKVYINRSHQRKEKIHYLEVIANQVKMACQFRKKLKKIKDEWLQKEGKEKVNKSVKEFKASWDNRLKNFEINNHLDNWFVILYIIPRIETTIMLFILTFALTSYDIHPLGCLSPIDVSYSETESFANLKISENVIRYQRASAVLIILLLIIWLIFKLFQFLLLPRAQWGIRITKNKCCGCCPWSFSWIKEGNSECYQLQVNDNVILKEKEYS